MAKYELAKYVDEKNGKVKDCVIVQIIVRGIVRGIPMGRGALGLWIKSRVGANILSGSIDCTVPT